MSVSTSMPGDASRPADPTDAHGDSPVSREGDLLGRRPFARLIARQIHVSRPTDGLVVAVVGRWGSGKTSVLRMVAEELADRSNSSTTSISREVIVVEFNPWLFSGSEQLTALFFVTLADQLPGKLGEDRATKVVQRLRRYGAALGTLRALPGIGGVFGAGADIAGETARRFDTSAVDLAGQRSALADTLRALDIHLVVLIDDVDRLETETELRDLMRMVKLVGDLPGVTYVLSYDRRPVVAALTSSGISGEEYLEKIVQVEHRLPEVLRDRLLTMLTHELNVAIRDLPDERLDADRWPEVAAKIIHPLVTTPRHVRRYGNALRIALDLHREEVDLVDQLALTAIETFLPTFHGQLPLLADALLPSAANLSALFPNQKEEAKTRLEDAAETSGAPDVASATYALLFPGTSRLLRNVDTGRFTERDAQRWRRVADPEAFWTYVTAALPEEALTVAEVRTVIEAMKDPNALIAELDRRDVDQLGTLCDRLRAHTGEVEVDDIPVVARVVVTHTRTRMRSRLERFDDPTRHVLWFAVDLISQLPDEARHNFLTAWAAEETEPMSKLAVYEVGHYKTDRGEPLIGDENLARVQGQLAAVVCAASPEELLGLQDVGRLLWLTGDHLERNDLSSLHALLDDDRLLDG